MLLVPRRLLTFCKRTDSTLLLLQARPVRHPSQIRQRRAARAPRMGWQGLPTCCR